MPNMILNVSVWNYLMLDVIGKIRSIFENDTECEHDNVWKSWGNNKWKLSQTESFKRLVWAVSNMDNARKKYGDIEMWSNGDIFVMLDTIESDDEGYIENTAIDSHTVFAAEDGSVISTNIIGKDKIGDQSSLVSVPQASIYI